MANILGRPGELDTQVVGDERVLVDGGRLRGSFFDQPVVGSIPFVSDLFFEKKKSRWRFWVIKNELIASNTGKCSEIGDFFFVTKSDLFVLQKRIFL